jgi:hypothetical protein
MVYDADGHLTGSWTAKKSDSAEGIATDGTDIWVVNTNNDVVHLYSDAASRVSGNQFPSSSFDLVAGSPTGITTDGSMLWITDVSTDQVYRYTTAGVLLSHWSLHSANTNARGLTIDPTGASNSVWVVDSDTDAVYEYDRDTGEFLGFFALDTAAGNSKPSGIADPPPPTVSKAHAPLPSASLSKPEDHLPSPSILFAMNGGNLPWLSAVAWPNAEQLVDDAVESEVAEPMNWERREWLLAVDATHHNTKSNFNCETSAARLLKYIADEKAELLDEDLLDLILGSQP